MELMACITGLQTLRYPCKVTLYSDSSYVVNGITKGWAKRWKSKGWMRTPTDAAVNPDLWGTLLDLCDTHDVTFEWVRGHAGHEENERCDRLSVAAASGKDLPPDVEYERLTEQQQVRKR
jgi:ribonuclease HI